MKTSIDVLTEYTEDGWDESYFGISRGTRMEGRKSKK